MSSAPRKPEPGRRQVPGSEAGWTIFSYLLGGMAVYGGIGWLISKWAGHTSAFLAGGMLAGLGLALTMIIMRYGRS